MSIQGLLLSLLASAVLLAQETPAPEIAFESVPNPLNLPADLYLGEVAGVAVNSKGHIFIFDRAARTPSSSSTHGRLIREIGKDLYGFYQAHVVRVDKDDNIWCVDEGTNTVINSIPLVTCRWCSGGSGSWSMALLRSLRRMRRRPARGQLLQSTDGRGLGCGRQHLRERWLQQLARRQVRQGRQLDQVVGRARQRARPVQHPAHHRDRREPDRCMWGIARTGASRCSRATARS